jgi:hypothetical protein
LKGGFSGKLMTGLIEMTKNLRRICYEKIPQDWLAVGLWNGSMAE